MITVFLYYTVLYTVVLGQTLKSSTDHSLEIQSASQIQPDCPDDFVLDDNSTWCYYYSLQDFFGVALFDCLNRGSLIAEPNSTDEIEFILELAANKSDYPHAIWVGNSPISIWGALKMCPVMIVDTDVPWDLYGFTTITKCNEMYAYVCKTSPIEKKHGENCSELAKCSSEFVCYEFRCWCGPYKYFLAQNKTCEKINKDIKESASLILPGCPKDFFLKVTDNLARCYKYSSDSDTFFGAVFACQRQGSILAEPRSPTENANIFGLAAVKLYPNVIWIGITDINTEGDSKYYSDNGSLEWNPLLIQNQVNGILDCVLMLVIPRYIGPWAYYDCSKTYHYVCQASPIEKKYGENCSELAKCSSEFVCDDFRCSCGPDEHFLQHNETCGKNDIDIKDKSKKPGEPKSSRYSDLLRYGGLTLLILALLILPCCVFYFLRKRKKSVSEESEEQTEMTYSWSTMNKSKPNKSKPNTSKPNTSKPNKSKPNTSKQNTSKPNKSKPNTSKPNTSKPNTSEPNTSTGYTSEPNTSTGYTSDPYTSTTYPTGEPTSSPEWTSAISASTKT